MLEIKNTVTEIKDAFDGLISKLDTGQTNNLWAWKYLSRNLWHKKD